MKSCRTLDVSLLASASLAALITAGCATRPPSAAKMAQSPMGTVTTFHRKSSGSLGAFDGPVVWTQSASTWQGQPVVAAVSPQAGATLHDPGSWAMIAVLAPDGKPNLSFDPPVGYDWPLVVGKRWSSSHTVTMHASGRTTPLKIDWKVDSWGDVTVPAGTFKAFKLVWTDDQGETETRWVSPDEGLGTVKRHVERPATHPRGAGVLDGELLSRKLPAQ
jgi:hypothetical protein